MSDIEKRKLTAAWLNIIAAGVVTTGGVAQIVSVLGGDGAAHRGAPVLALALLCLGLGTGLHLIARAVVGNSAREH